MGMSNPFDQAIADELGKVGDEMVCKRYPRETNDEFGYRLIALIEDAIDEHEAAIAHLDKFYATVKALL